MPLSSCAALDRGDVLVRFRSTEAVGADELRAALAVLSSDERARGERFRIDPARRDFAIAHALLRTTLGEVGGIRPADWRFDADVNGKPRVAQDGHAPCLRFSLTHTRGFVACVVARDVDVGIDVERTARAADWRGVASRFFSAAEMTALDGVTDPERQAARFIELWTLKEAWAKATGVGVPRALAMAAFEIAADGAIRATLPEPTGSAAWYFELQSPEPGVRLALAVCEGGPDGRPLRNTIGARASFASAG